MKLTRITPEEYAAVFDCHAPYIYNSVPFCELNRDKAERLHYLAMGHRSPRLGIIVGERRGALLSPFSAPFGGFTARGRQATEHYFAAASLLSDYARSLCMPLQITLPPALYAPDHIGKQIAALTGSGKLLHADTNHHRTLDFGNHRPHEFFQQKGRNTYYVAARQGFEAEIVVRGDYTGYARAYEVIRRNHEQLDHPLRMSYEAVVATAPIAGSFFIILTLGNEDVAAAMINRTSPRVAQMIYWGDMMEQRHLHPMNMLAEIAMDHCRDLGFEILDIGPSSEGGVPATGLCRFKESIGCDVSAKLTFQL